MLVLLAALLACDPADPPKSRAPDTATVTTGPDPSATIPDPSTTSTTPPAACERDPDFADWPGGRSLRLDVAPAQALDRGVGPLPRGVDVLLTVSGAEPGEIVHFHLGDACGLDCPVDLDGACFQPAASVDLGTVAADAAGIATLTAHPDATWEGRWLVFQASDPDRRALSQAWVDRVDGWYTAIGAEGEWVELSPLTVHSLLATSSEDGVLDEEQWFVPVPAGRRFVASWSQVSEDDDGDRYLVVGGHVTPVALYYGGTEFIELDRPGALWWSQYFDYGPGAYVLDFSTQDLVGKADWHPDADGDGFGDPSGAPVRSEVPLPGSAPNALDCDDATPAIRPEGVEICDDGVDQDCDGADRPCAETADLLPPHAGSLRIGAPVTYAGGRLAVGDVDADGAPDLATVGRALQHWPLDRADRTAPAVAIDGHLEELAVGDVTGDGADDVVTADGDTLRIWEGPVASGDPVPAAILLASAQPLVPAVGDVTGDGVGDLLVRTSGGPSTIEVFPGPVGAAPVAAESLAVPSGPWHRPGIALGDADGDGLADVWDDGVCLTLAPLTLAGDAPVGCVDEGPDSALGLGGLAAYDVDGDGHGDLVTADGYGIHVFPGTLSGTHDGGDVEWASIDADVWEYAAITVAPDRDGDDAPEIVFVNPDGAWTFSARPGAWSAADATLLAPPDGDGSPWAALGGDFDGDGVGDVAVASPSASHGADLYTGAVTILWGAGAP